MNSQDLHNLQEAYMDVYGLDEDKRPIYGRGGAIRKTETPLQIYGKQTTARDKRTKHNIPKGGTTIDKRDPDELFSGDYDRGSGNAAKRRAKGLTKPEAKKFPNRLTRSDKQGIKDSYEYDLYDIILSHLLDEGYADTEQAAEAIMVNMSEEWRESICEGYVPLRTSDEHYDDEGFPTTTRSWDKKMTNARIRVGRQKMRSRENIGDPIRNLTKGVSAKNTLDAMKKVDNEPESVRAKRSQAKAAANRQLGTNRRSLQTSLDREHLTKSLKSS